MFNFENVLIGIYTFAMVIFIVSTLKNFKLKKALGQMVYKDQMKITINGFNFFMFTLLFYVQFLSWGYFSVTLSILMSLAFMAMMIDNGIKAIKKNRIHEKGLVSYNGTYRWHDVINYEWIRIRNKNMSVQFMITRKTLGMTYKRFCIIKIKRCDYEVVQSFLNKSLLQSATRHDWNSS